MTLYTMPISLPNAKEPEEFRFYVSGRNVKIQWAMAYNTGVRATQAIDLDAWFDRDWLDAYGLNPNYKGGTFSIDTAREMWKYLQYRHSADAKQRQENRKATA